jgi:predicted peptidase
MKYLLFIFSLVFFTSCSKNLLPKEEKGVFLKGAYANQKITIPYRYIFPKVKANGKIPLLLFLHGGGERGNDNEKQLKHGSKWIQENIEKHPMVVLMPQCPQTGRWANVVVNTSHELPRFTFSDVDTIGVEMTALMELLEKFENMPYIDKNRIYIGGLSMGGFGTIELMWRKPNHFAAAFPICAAGNPQKVPLLAQTKNAWFFHGTDDKVVKPEMSQVLVDGIVKINPDVKYTIYPGVEHNSWDNVFAEKGFFDWLSSCKLKK